MSWLYECACARSGCARTGWPGGQTAQCRLLGALHGRPWRQQGRVVYHAGSGAQKMLTFMLLLGIAKASPRMQDPYTKSHGRL
eukprot:1138027-Pelagomonas_calceolata.AAC.4